MSAAGRHLVLIIDSLGPGGAERVAVNLATSLTQRDWRVTILTIQDEAEDFHQAPITVERITLASIIPAPFRKRRGRRWFKALRYLMALLRLRSTVKKIQPDVILSFITEMNVLALILLFRSGIPVVVSEHSNPSLDKTSWLPKSLRPVLYRRASSVISLTQQSAEWLKHNTGAPRITIIPNAAPYPLPSTEPCVPPAVVTENLRGSRLLLSAGRLVGVKAFDRLILAFAEAVGSDESWNLAIVGEGPLRNELQQLVDDLGLRNLVALPGIVGNPGDWYAKADLFGLTSRYEGFSNVLVEALSYGCPVVAVDCDTGPRDIVRHNIDGLLVPQDDHRELVGALKRMMSDEKFREECASNATAARLRFAPDLIAMKYESVFENAKLFPC